MSRAVECPSCGGQHEVHNPGITALCCQYCTTLFYWDAEAVRDSGRKSQLDPPSSSLRVRASATLRGEPVTVIGRVRYSYGGGVWDEWFLEDRSQKILWLTEDEKELSLETPMPPDPTLPAFDSLSAGGEVTIQSQSYRVEELGRATCVGVEGQLPFVVIPDETYPFADLAGVDGSSSLGLEYDEQGSPTLFAGEPIPRDALKVEGGPVFPTVTAGGAAVSCKGCGAPITQKLQPDTEMVVCPQCGAGLELSGTEVKVVFENPEAPAFVLEIGARGALAGTTYEVVGRLYYVEVDGYVEYPSYEYLLYDEATGYRWLEESSGHWSLSAPSHAQPSRDLFSYLTPKTTVRAGGKSYRFVESGVEELRYVDGALPWVAKVGETFDYAEACAPPFLFGAERSRTGDSEEVELFEGRYVYAQEVKTAFGIEAELAPAVGVAPAQPFIRTATQKILMAIGSVVGFANIALLLVVALPSGTVVLRDEVTPEKYRGEHLTEAFAVTSKVIEISGSAPVSNSWVSLDFGLVDAEDKVIGETAGEASYYSGVEGGERWSEGSKDFSTLLRVEKPGNYRLLLFGSAGQGETAAASGGPTVQVVVKDGVVMARYFIAMLILAFLYPLKEGVRRHAFEAQRFPSDDDDDDD